MYFFTFGTFSGLFVQSEEPAALPRDLSFFDLRRQNSRAIPEHFNTPNLLVRKTLGKYEDGLLIALIFKVSEGNRNGFLAFGSLLTWDDISYKKIVESIEKAIDVAVNTKLMADGKILSPPGAQVGDLIDLTEIPIGQSDEHFAEFQFDMFKKGGKDELAHIIEKRIIENVASCFEIVFNQNSGQEIEALEGFIEQHSIKTQTPSSAYARDFEALQEKISASKSKGQLDLNKFSREPSSSSNVQLKIIMGIGVFSFIALLLFLIFFWFSTSDNGSKYVGEFKDRKGDGQGTANFDNGQDYVGEFKDRQGTRTSKTNSESNKKLWDRKCSYIANGGDPNFFYVEKGLAEGLGYTREEISNCIQLSKDTQTNLQRRMFYDKPFHQNIIITDDKSFTSFLDEFADNFVYLVSFKSFFDALDNSNVKTEDKYIFALDQRQDSAITLHCDKEFLKTLDNNNFPKEFKLFYFTTSKQAYDKLLSSLAENYQNWFKDLIKDLKETEDENLGLRLENIYKEDFKDPPPSLPNDTEISNGCVISADPADSALLKDQNENLEPIKASDFLKKNIFSDNQKKEETLPSCDRIPNFVMLWRKEEKENSNFIIDNLALNPDLKLDIADIRFFDEKNPFIFPHSPQLKKEIRLLSDIFNSENYKIIKHPEDRSEDFCTSSKELDKEGENFSLE